MRIQNLFKARYKRFDADVEPPSYARKYGMLLSALRASDWGRVGQIQDWLDAHELVIPETLEEAEKYANGYRLGR